MVKQSYILGIVLSVFLFCNSIGSANAGCCEGVGNEEYCTGKVYYDTFFINYKCQGNEVSSANTNIEICDLCMSEITTNAIIFIVLLPLGIMLICITVCCWCCCKQRHRRLTTNSTTTFTTIHSGYQPVPTNNNYDTGFTSIGIVKQAQPTVLPFQQYNPVPQQQQQQISSPPITPYIPSNNNNNNNHSKPTSSVSSPTKLVDI